MVDIEAVTYPDVRQQLIERIVDKSAAYYLAPLPLLKAEAKRLNANILQLASLFDMSPSAIKICLRDYGLHL